MSIPFVQTFIAQLNDDVIEPKSYSEAIQSKYSTQWKKAMDKEFQALIDNKTWTIVDLPKSAQTLNSK